MDLTKNGGPFSRGSFPSFDRKRMRSVLACAEDEAVVQPVIATMLAFSSEVPDTRWNLKTNWTGNSDLEYQVEVSYGYSSKEKPPVVGGEMVLAFFGVHKAHKQWSAYNQATKRLTAYVLSTPANRPAKQLAPFSLGSHPSFDRQRMRAVLACAEDEAVVQPVIATMLAFSSGIPDTEWKLERRWVQDREMYHVEVSYGYSTTTEPPIVDGDLTIAVYCVHRVHRQWTAYDQATKRLSANALVIPANQPVKWIPISVVVNMIRTRMAASADL